MSTDISQLVHPEFHVYDEFLKQKRPYQDSLFVNRKRELAAISENVRQAQGGGGVTAPIINFWGGTGIGKTWILKHLNTVYRYSKDAKIDAGIPHPTFVLPYAFSSEASGLSLGNMTRALAHETLAQLASTLLRGEREELEICEASGDVRVLVKALVALTRQFVPLLLLDDAERVRDSDWEKLEQHFLEPIVSTNQVLIVVAGRRQVPRWRRFEVRRRVMETQKSRVAPFEKSDVATQLKERECNIPADLLFPYTGGNPHYVEAISRNICEWTKNRKLELDREWFRQRGNEFLSILQLAERQSLEGCSEGLTVTLRGISPVRFYRIEALRFMLGSGVGEAGEQPDGHYLNILRALEQTEVVWWDRERRAYMTSEMIRQIMNQRELLSDPALYRKKQQQAVEMYWRWVKEFPRASEDFIVEIWFHQVCLYLSHGNINTLRSEIMQALHYAYEHLDTDRLMVLPRQLHGDHEILDLVPENLPQELSQELETLVDAKSNGTKLDRAKKS